MNGFSTGIEGGSADRLEELTLGHLEGSLSREEAGELERLCREDTSALAFAAGEVLAARVMREALSGPDTAAARARVLASLEALSRVAGPGEFKGAVLERLRRRSRRRLRPGGTRRRSLRGVWLAAGAVAAAAVFVVIARRVGPGGERPSLAERVTQVTGAGTSEAVPAEVRGSAPTRTGGPAPVAFVVSAKGGAEIARSPGGRRVRAAEGAAVFEGDSLHARGGIVRLRTEAGSAVHVKAGTTLACRTSGPGPGLALLAGEIFVETTAGDRGLTVETPHGSVADTGTRFGVLVDEAGTRAAVVEGIVSASTDAGAARVRGGQEVVLVSRETVPGDVRRAAGLAARFSWALDGSAHTGMAVPPPVVLYLFDEAGGATVHDRSGLGEPLDLKVLDPGAVAWTEGGLDVAARTLIASKAPALKITAACAATNEVSIEAWVRPASADQVGPARIVAVSSHPGDANVVLGQGTQYDDVGTKYVFRVRTTSQVGGVQLETPPGALTATLTHVVVTRDAAGGRCIYVDGDLHARQRLPGDLANWSVAQHLVLADEITRDRPWLGEYLYLAVYDRALGADLVRSRYRAGPAGKASSYTRHEEKPAPGGKQGP